MYPVLISVIINIIVITTVEIVNALLNKLLKEKNKIIETREKFQPRSYYTHVE